MFIKGILKTYLRLSESFWVSFESLSLIETHLKKSINIESFKTNILTHPFAFPIDFYVYFAKQHIVCKTNETFILMVIMGPALCCLKRNMALLKVLGHQLMLLLVTIIKLRHSSIFITISFNEASQLLNCHLLW